MIHKEMGQNLLQLLSINYQERTLKYNKSKITHESGLCKLNYMTCS